MENNYNLDLFYVLAPSQVTRILHEELKEIHGKLKGYIHFHVSNRTDFYPRGNAITWTLRQQIQAQLKEDLATL